VRSISSAGRSSVSIGGSRLADLASDSGDMPVPIVTAAGGGIASSRSISSRDENWLTRASDRPGGSGLAGGVLAKAAEPDASGAGAGGANSGAAGVFGNDGAAPGRWPGSEGSVVVLAKWIGRVLVSKKPGGC